MPLQYGCSREPSRISLGDVMSIVIQQTPSCCGACQPVSGACVPAGSSTGPEVAQHSTFTHVCLQLNATTRELQRHRCILVRLPCVKPVGMQSTHACNVARPGEFEADRSTMQLLLACNTCAFCQGIPYLVDGCVLV